MKNKITIIITILLLILLSVYIYKDINEADNSEVNRQDQELSEEQMTDILKESGIEIEGGGDYKIEQISIEEFDVKEVPKPIPNLDESIKNNASLPEEAKKIVDSKIAELVEKLKNDPSDFYSWIALGIRAKTLEDYEKTVEFWKYAIRLSPDNKVSYNNLGDLYHYFIRDFKKSEEYFLEALEVDPNYVFTYRGLHELYKYSYKQDTDEAANILLRGLIIFPNEINLLVPLADYYKEKGNNEEAIEYYDKAIEQAKKDNNLEISSELQKEVLFLLKN